MNQLVGASEADPDLGFMARLLALCAPSPRTNPGNRLLYKRVNGPYRLYMQAGPENKLPFGWARRFPSSCGKLDIYGTSGGSRGERTRLRNQMKWITLEDESCVSPARSVGWC